MNRRIKKHLENVRKELNHIEACLGLEEEPTEEEPEVIIIPSNWTAADEPAKDSVYMKDLKELTGKDALKGITIIGQIKTVFDMKSYVGTDKETGQQYPGLIYRFVLSDLTGDVTTITFDDMAKKFKEFTIGQILKITNAWKMEKNKSDVIELHVGNFAKVEVVE